MVCDARHFRDQAAWLLQRVYSELRKAGLHIHYYDFDRHPQMVWPREKPGQQAIPLAQLRHRHPDGDAVIGQEGWLAGLVTPACL